MTPVERAVSICALPWAQACGVLERAHWLDSQSLCLFEKSESVIRRARDLLERIAASASEHRSATE